MSRATSEAVGEKGRRGGSVVEQEPEVGRQRREGIVDVARVARAFRRNVADQDGAHLVRVAAGDIAVATFFNQALSSKPPAAEDDSEQPAVEGGSEQAAVEDYRER